MYAKLKVSWCSYKKQTTQICVKWWNFALLMLLMIIRLHLFDEDIAYHFSVHRATVSRNFPKVLDKMAVKLARL